MTEGLHYPVYITPPKVINLTAEQFNKLSYLGIGALWCSWKYLFEKTDTGYNMWGVDYRIHQWFGHKRFEGCTMYNHSSAEMGSVEIPQDNPIVAWIEKHCQHLIMK